MTATKPTSGGAGRRVRVVRPLPDTAVVLLGAAAGLAAVVGWLLSLARAPHAFGARDAQGAALLLAVAVAGVGLLSLASWIVGAVARVRRRRLDPSVGLGCLGWPAAAFAAGYVGRLLVT